MADKIINIGEHINKKDLEIILEVNRKAIEIETNVADQNEEIIELLNESKTEYKKIHDVLDKLSKQTDEMNKDLFKIQVLFVTGLLGLIVQVVEIFLKK